MAVNLSNLNRIKKEVNEFKNSQLCIVTKNRSHEDILELIKLGNKIFGENKVQEAKQKYTDLFKFDDFELHLIGPLQSNKVKLALKIFDSIQSIDRTKLIDCISNEIKLSMVKTSSFFLQVNIGNEKQKSGVNIDDIKSLYDYGLNKNLNIIGLMCIPPANDDPIKYFQKMLSIRDRLNPKLKLSMGMSSDYIQALKNESDMVRIGSKIFE